MSTLKTTNIAHPSSASNNIVLDASGNVVLQAGSASTPALQPSGDTNTGIFFPAADTIAFAEGGVESMRIDSSSRLLVGTSTSIGGLTQIVGNTAGGGIPLLHLRGTDLVGGGQRSVFIDFSAVTDDTGPVYTNIARISAFKENNGQGNEAGSLVLSTTADGASSPTERMRIQSDGSILLHKTTNNFGTPGTFIGAGGQFNFVVNADDVLNVNRLTDDGKLIRLFQASTEEGNISVSGTTVSYNGAHLSRWSQLPGIDLHDKDQRPEILRGTVMSNLDEMCDWIDPETDEPQDNEQLNKTKISEVEGDKNVAGIFQSWDDDDDTWVNDYYLAMTGDFIIRIAADTTVERGDLLMSAGDGTAKPQDDDIIRSRTIAKVTSTNVSCTYEDGSYCVPCVLMAC